MNEHLRQTGRTGRTVEEAVQLARNGRAVYILVHERRYIKQVQERVDKLWQHLTGDFLHLHGIKVETSADLGNWDWEKMHLHRAHPNTAVVLDHFLVEHRIAVLQEEMKRLAAQVGRLYPLTV